MEMFLDPMNDCPDKLIWALCGYLAWRDDVGSYTRELKQLKAILDYRLAEVEE
jgi:hypothetical protein